MSHAEIRDSGNAVKFVQITDVHLHDGDQNRGSRMYAHSENLLKDAIKQVNSMEDVDFVVFTGDMTGYPKKGLLEKFITIANELRVPWFWTTGNHDVDEKFGKKDFLKVLNKNSPFIRDKTYYSFRTGKFTFIFMDGAISNRNSANGFFSQEELHWLEKTISDNRDSYVVIFQHFPVVEPFKSRSHYVRNSEEYLKILDKYDNVTAVMTGHYHAARVNIRNNVVHISSPALVQYPNAIRAVTLENIDEYVTISLDFRPTTLEKVKTESFHQVSSVKLYAGDEKDQSRVIMLHKPLSIFLLK